MKFLEAAEYWLTMAMIGFCAVMFWALVWLVVIVHGVVWAAVILASIYTWFFVVMGIRFHKSHNESKDLS